MLKSNQYYYQRPNGQVGEAHFAQQIKKPFLLNCYKESRFNGVDYGAAKRTGSPQERAARRLVYNKNTFK